MIGNKEWFALLSPELFHLEKPFFEIKRKSYLPDFPHRVSKLS